MTSHSAPLRLAALLGLACLFGGSPATAQSQADALSEGLIRLRAEVEQLNSELELLREEQRSSLGSLNAQRAELEAGLNRQQLAAREVRAKLDAAQAEASEAGVEGEELKPLLETALRGLQAHVRAGLPFKTEERLAELDAFWAQVENGTLPPMRAVNRLWAFFEDEIRLTRDNGLYSQTIALGDERVLAEVAKVGSLALYYRTQDGRVGRAERTGESWRFAALSDAADIARIDALFDAYRKQIRQGFFELPLATGGAR